MIRLLDDRYMQYLASLSASILTITMGSTAWSSPILPLLQLEDSPIGVVLTSEEATWIASILLVGVAVGNAIMGPLMDLCGRRGLLLLSTIPIFGSWMIILFANSFAMLMIARFLTGFGIVVPTGVSIVYISEITEAPIRGKLCMVNLLMGEFGIVLITILGSYLSYSATAICSSLIPVIFLLIFIWMPESPYYYLRKGNVSRATQCLQRLRPNSDIEKEILDMQTHVEKEMKNKSSVLEFFKNDYYKKILFITCGLKTLQQMSGYVAFVNYLTSIFSKASTGLDANQSAVISSSVALPSVVISSLLIDKMGRKVLYYISVTGCILALFSELLYFVLQDRTNYDVTSLGWLPISGVMMFNIFRVFAVNTIPVIIISELYPANIKGIGVSITLVYSSILGFLVSFMFPYITDFWGIDICFLIFMTFCIIGLFFVIFAVPETKGKSLGRIQDELTGQCTK